MYYTYIIKSASLDTYYIGSTNDIERRLEEHNSGKSQYTKGKGPWIKVLVLEKPSKSEAMKLEKKLKNLHSKPRLEKFIEKYR